MLKLIKPRRGIMVGNSVEFARHIMDKQGEGYTYDSDSGDLVLLRQPVSGDDKGLKNILELLRSVVALFGLQFSAASKSQVLLLTQIRIFLENSSGQFSTELNNQLADTYNQLVMSVRMPQSGNSIPWEKIENIEKSYALQQKDAKSDLDASRKKVSASDAAKRLWIKNHTYARIQKTSVITGNSINSNMWQLFRRNRGLAGIVKKDKVFLKLITDGVKKQKENVDLRYRFSMFVSSLNEHERKLLNDFLKGDAQEVSINQQLLSRLEDPLQYLLSNGSAFEIRQTFEKLEKLEKIYRSVSHSSYDRFERAGRYDYDNEYPFETSSEFTNFLNQASLTQLHRFVDFLESRSNYDEMQIQFFRDTLSRYERDILNSRAYHKRLEKFGNDFNSFVEENMKNYSDDFFVNMKENHFVKTKYAKYILENFFSEQSKDVYFDFAEYFKKQNMNILSKLVLLCGSSEENRQEWEHFGEHVRDTIYDLTNKSDDNPMVEETHLATSEDIYTLQVIQKGIEDKLCTLNEYLIPIVEQEETIHNKEHKETTVSDIIMEYDFSYAKLRSDMFRNIGLFDADMLQAFSENVLEYIREKDDSGITMSKPFLDLAKKIEMLYYGFDIEYDSMNRYETRKYFEQYFHESDAVELSLVYQSFYGEKQLNQETLIQGFFQKSREFETQDKLKLLEFCQESKQIQVPKHLLEQADFLENNQTKTINIENVKTAMLDYITNANTELYKSFEKDQGEVYQKLYETLQSRTEEMKDMKEHFIADRLSSLLIGKNIIDENADGVMNNKSLIYTAFCGYENDNPDLNQEKQELYHTIRSMVTSYLYSTEQTDKTQLRTSVRETIEHTKVFDGFVKRLFSNDSTNSEVVRESYSAMTNRLYMELVGGVGHSSRISRDFSDYISKIFRNEMQKLTNNGTNSLLIAQDKLTESMSESILKRFKRTEKTESGVLYTVRSLILRTGREPLDLVRDFPVKIQNRIENFTRHGNFIDLKKLQGKYSITTRNTDGEPIDREYAYYPEQYFESRRKTNDIHYAYQSAKEEDRTDRVFDAQLAQIRQQISETSEKVEQLHNIKDQFSKEFMRISDKAAFENDITRRIEEDIYMAGRRAGVY